MIEHEMILLGLLKESPKHGYQIKKKVKEILSFFAGVELKSIYYPLTVLEKKGLVIKEVGKEGKRPQRYIYELTPKGEARFNQLLSDSFLNFKRPQFSLDLSLYLLNHIQPEIAKRRLRARLFIFKKLILDLSKMSQSMKDKENSPLSLSRIIEHDLKMVETEAKFLSGLIRTL